ncbi:DUF202 domain-containing protein [Streptomyces axinellae]|uniref:DUF202 domain-containing protein n=1 Tax=Streptomyces axinellae TaxID=552788 RepID=A0ABP6D4A7_9ACTN
MSPQGRREAGSGRRPETSGGPETPVGPGDPPGPPGTPVRDPGAQPERTWFAWRRTTLAFAVAAALAARSALRDATAVPVLAACLGALAWLALLVTAHRRIGALSGTRPAAMGAREVGGVLVPVLVLIIVGVMTL